MPNSIRPPAVAGLFYPGEGPQLIEGVLAMLESAPSCPAKMPKALIAPHAGYVYSGSTAATAYARLIPWGDRIERVVLLGPSHRVPLRGLALPAAESFATPLGWVNLDQSAIAPLLAHPCVQVSEAAHAHEHSLEVHLPFLQAVIDHFTIVPLVVGLATPQEVADVLETVWDGERTLVVVSTDLSHFLPYTHAQKVDRLTCDAILRSDGRIEPEQACGAYPLNGFLLAARRRGLRPEMIMHCNSGDTAGDRERVVGYAAFAFYATTENPNG